MDYEICKDCVNNMGLITIGKDGISHLLCKKMSNSTKELVIQDGVCPVYEKEADNDT